MLTFCFNIYETLDMWKEKSSSKNGVKKIEISVKNKKVKTEPFV